MWEQNLRNSGCHIWHWQNSGRMSTSQVIWPTHLDRVTSNFNFLSYSTCLSFTILPFPFRCTSPNPQKYTQTGFFPSENHRDCWRWRISSAREIWLTWFAWHALYRTNPFRSERLARRSLYNVRDKPRRYEILQRKHFNSFYLFCMEWADDNFPLELTLNLTKVTLVKILTHLQNRMNQSYNNRQQNNNYILI